MYKSVKYITTNRTTYKLLKHKDNTVDVWATREECKNQNCVFSYRYGIRRRTTDSAREGCEKCTARVCKIRLV